MLTRDDIIINRIDLVEFEPLIEKASKEMLLERKPWLINTGEKFAE